MRGKAGQLTFDFDWRAETMCPRVCKHCGACRNLVVTFAGAPEATERGSAQEVCLRPLACVDSENAPSKGNR